MSIKTVEEKRRELKEEGKSVRARGRDRQNRTVKEQINKAKILLDTLEAVWATSQQHNIMNMNSNKTPKFMTVHIIQR